MLVKKKVKYLFRLQASAFCMLILEIAFILYPQHSKLSIGLLVIGGFLGLSLFLFGWSSGKEELGLTIMIDIICILLLFGISFETDLLGEYKWMLTLTALAFFLSDLGRGINRLEKN